VLHCRSVKTPYLLILHAIAIFVLQVATVLAVDAHRYAGCPGYWQDLQRRQIAAMYDMRAQLVAVGMEVAKGFPEEDIEYDDEQVFREALGPKIREHDPAALKAGHWT
jgi:hypothetical protein